MPLQPRGASYYTDVVKSSAEANAAVGGAVSRGGNAVPPKSLGAVRSVVNNNIIAQIQFQIQDNMPGPPGPTGAAGPAGLVGPTGPAGSGGSGSFTPIGIDIWGGSPPATAEEAINRLAALLYARTFAQGPLAPLPNNTQIFTINTESDTADAFIVKYNTDGTPQWVRRIGGASGIDQGTGISSDSSGNVYATGFYTGTATVFAADGSSTAFSLTNTGSSDAFIVKYDTSGTPQWVRRIGGAGADQGLGISSDSSGNVYATGYCGSTATVFAADGSSTAFSLANAGSSDAFIVKYDTSGTPEWARRIGGTGADQGIGISTDSSSNVYVTGSYTGSAIVFAADGSTTAIALPTALTTDAFIVKYDTSGTPQWARRIGGAGTKQASAVSIDSSGNIYVTGSYVEVGLVFASDGLTVAFVMPYSYFAYTNCFVVKYDASGIPQWARRISSSANNSSGSGIVADVSGNVSVVGSYSNGAIVTGGSEGNHVVIQLTTDTINDAFVVKYNTNGTPQWARRIGGAATTEQGLGVSSDSSGNVYVTGYCGSTATVFAADGSTTAFSLANAGGNDAFIVKYDTNGTPQWARRIGGTGADQGMAISSDSSGNVYATGYCTGAATVFATDNLTSFASLTNAGSTDVFIVKYDTSGTPQWARKIGGTGADQGLGISSDSSGNVYATGYYTGTATVFAADNSTSFASLTNAGSSDVFIVKYNTSGIPQWARRIGGAGADQGMGISSDSSGNVYATGYCTGAATVFATDNLTSFASLTNTGSSDAFIVKYDTSGTPQWVRRIGGTGADQGMGIASDSSGNVYASGYSASATTVFAADGTTAAFSLANAGSNDAFIVKYDTSGTPQWVRRIAGSGNDQGLGISSDSSGNVYVSGFNTGATVYAADGTTIFASLVLLGNAYSDSFVVKYDTNGTPQWARRIGGTNDDRGIGIASDSSGNVYTTGYSTGTTIAYDTDAVNVFTTLTSLGLTDVFIVKYDTSGTPQWVRRIGGVGTDSGSGISSDLSGNLYVIGSATGTSANVYAADGITKFATLANIATSTTDIFIVKYNASGIPQWMRRIGSTANDSGTGIASDSSGNVYATGSSTGRTLILGAGVS